MNKILIAGATGYLGKHIAQALKEQEYYTRVIVRNPEKFKAFGIQADEIIRVEVTDKSSLVDCCKDIDTVISSVGITKQKDGLGYMDVDYQANMNLLEEAIKSGVRKFVYVSVLNGDKLKQLQICAAKEKFVEKLKQSGLEYCIIRPDGFFSDMTEFYNMAKSGRVYLFGNGNLKANPIHGEDLARVCVDAVVNNDDVVNVGGPEVLTQIEIAKIAFDAVGKRPKISHIPDWLRRFVLQTLRFFMNKKKFGPIEFFMTVMAMDMIAPQYGNRTLKEYFEGLKRDGK